MESWLTEDKFINVQLIACYETPKQKVSQAEWNSIINNVNTNKHCILVGDFNSHNIIWNCSKIDVSGERLLESIDECNLFLHNDNKITHEDVIKNIKSNIDLVFSTVNLADKINVKIHDDLLGSDHYPIFINVHVEKSFYAKKSLRTNWENFTTVLDNNYKNFLTNEYDELSTENKYELFAVTINNAVVNNRPKPKVISDKKED